MTELLTVGTGQKVEHASTHRQLTNAWLCAQHTLTSDVKPHRSTNGSNLAGAWRRGAGDRGRHVSMERSIFAQSSTAAAAAYQ